MKYSLTILFILTISLLFFSCKKDQPIIYLSENAKSFFPYYNHDTLVFADSLGNLIRFSTISAPASKIESSHEVMYVNFFNDTSDLKILFEIAARENNLHHLTIGFFIEPEPQIIDEIATFDFYTDTISPYVSFNFYDTTYNKTYDTIRLNLDNYNNVLKLWGTDDNPVKTVYILKELGIVGFMDTNNEIWNLK